MGSIVSSLVSNFFKAVGNLFSAPLDFLSGKSCSATCGSTWDLMCYIENFCVANLLKLVAVLFLFYMVLLFFYLLYKTGICQCLGRSICKMIWACATSCYSSCEYCCMFLRFKIRKLKKMKHEHSMSMEEYNSSTTSSEEFEARSKEFRRSLSRRSKERRRAHLERSLRPRSHRISVGITRSYPEKSKKYRNVGSVHDIRVTRTSKFVQKSSLNRRYRKW
ncbi:hypothetical protein IHE45_14G073100 [Dioscorea alata]|uniref:Uncharacterized protein n=1 Tax=Dioscorea alata TaxID=55571 RepID=A0ACB7USU2_DIOAL|nr:hypothetical protein IHE45_14G073100 [Dioscorea alata]